MVNIVVVKGLGEKKEKGEKDVLLDLGCLFTETSLIEHVVSLVQDEHFDLSNVELAAFDGIHDGAWCADDNGSSNSSRAIDTTGNSRLHVKVRNELPNSLNDILNLASEFSGWGQNESLGLVRFAVVNP